eukprot:TRINITY_DN6651_c0_g1_i1.p1 TRINITY_DN6651_c0_g1~~TRINITY_DN6651_c0_g1_i1.p1  ORF type:complete len:2646 (+),score=557.41 TRINITY_DN6651_c0_g1_i1:722-7939(+)
MHQQREKAAKRYSTALDVCPGLPLALLRLGQAYVALHRPDRALATLEELIKICPDSACAHYAIGTELCLSNKNLDRATEHLAIAISLDPNFGRAQAAYAELLWLRVGDEESAAAVLEKGLALRPQNLSMLLIRARLSMHRFEQTRARPLLDRVLADTKAVLHLSPSERLADQLHKAAEDALAALMSGEGPHVSHRTSISATVGGLVDDGSLANALSWVAAANAAVKANSVALNIPTTPVPPFEIDLPVRSVVWAVANQAEQTKFLAAGRPALMHPLVVALLFQRAQFEPADLRLLIRTYAIPQQLCGYISLAYVATLERLNSGQVDAATLAAVRKQTEAPLMALVQYSFKDPLLAFAVSLSALHALLESVHSASDSESRSRVAVPAQQLVQHLHSLQPKAAALWPEKSLILAMVVEVQRGNVAVLKGLKNEARQHYLAAHRLRPQQALPLCALAMSELHFGVPDNAELLLDEVVSGNLSEFRSTPATLTAIHAVLGMCGGIDSNYLSELHTAVDSDPYHGPARAYLAHALHFEADEPDEALDLVEIGLSLNSYSLPLRLVHSILALDVVARGRTNRLSTAVADFEVLTAARPDSDTLRAIHRDIITLGTIEASKIPAAVPPIIERLRAELFGRYGRYRSHPAPSTTPKQDQTPQGDTDSDGFEDYDEENDLQLCTEVDDYFSFPSIPELNEFELGYSIDEYAPGGMSIFDEYFADDDDFSDIIRHQPTPISTPVAQASAPAPTVPTPTTPTVPHTPATAQDRVSPVDPDAELLLRHVVAVELAAFDPRLLEVAMTAAEERAALPHRAFLGPYRSVMDRLCTGILHYSLQAAIEARETLTARALELVSPSFELCAVYIVLARAALELDDISALETALQKLQHLQGERLFPAHSVERKKFESAVHTLLGHISMRKHRLFDARCYFSTAQVLFCDESHIGALVGLVQAEATLGVVGNATKIVELLVRRFSGPSEMGRLLQLALVLTLRLAHPNAPNLPKHEHLLHPLEAVGDKIGYLDAFPLLLRTLHLLAMLLPTPTAAQLELPHRIIRAVVQASPNSIPAWLVYSRLAEELGTPVDPALPLRRPDVQEQCRALTAAAKGSIAALISIASGIAVAQILPLASTTSLPPPGEAEQLVLRFATSESAPVLLWYEPAAGTSDHTGSLALQTRAIQDRIAAAVVASLPPGTGDAAADAALRPQQEGASHLTEAQRLRERAERAAVHAREVAERLRLEREARESELREKREREERELAERRLKEKEKKQKKELEARERQEEERRERQAKRAKLEQERAQRLARERAAREAEAAERARLEAEKAARAAAHAMHPLKLVLHFEAAAADLGQLRELVTIHTAATDSSAAAVANAYSVVLERLDPGALQTRTAVLQAARDSARTLRQLARKIDEQEVRETLALLLAAARAAAEAVSESAAADAALEAVVAAEKKHMDLQSALNRITNERICCVIECIRGRIALSERDLRGARLHYCAAQRLVPAWAPATAGLLFAEAILGGFAAPAVLPLIRQLCQLSGSSLCRLWLGCASLDPLSESIEEAATEDPDSAYHCAMQGLFAWKKHGQDDAALSLANAALRLRSWSPAALMLRTTVNIRRAEKQRRKQLFRLAIADLEALLAYHPDSEALRRIRARAEACMDATTPDPAKVAEVCTELESEMLAAFVNAHPLSAALSGAKLVSSPGTLQVAMPCEYTPDSDGPTVQSYLAQAYAISDFPEAQGRLESLPDHDFAPEWQPPQQPASQQPQAPAAVPVAVRTKGGADPAPPATPPTQQPQPHSRQGKKKTLKPSGGDRIARDPPKPAPHLPQGGASSVLISAADDPEPAAPLPQLPQPATLHSANEQSLPAKSRSEPLARPVKLSPFTVVYDATSRFSPLIPTAAAMPQPLSDPEPGRFFARFEPAAAEKSDKPTAESPKAVESGTMPAEATAEAEHLSEFFSDPVPLELDAELERTLSNPEASDVEQQQPALIQQQLGRRDGSVHSLFFSTSPTPLAPSTAASAYSDGDAMLDLFSGPSPAPKMQPFFGFGLFATQPPDALEGVLEMDELCCDYTGLRAATSRNRVSSDSLLRACAQLYECRLEILDQGARTAAAQSLVTAELSARLQQQLLATSDRRAILAGQLALLQALKLDRAMSASVDSMLVQVAASLPFVCRNTVEQLRVLAALAVTSALRGLQMGDPAAATTALSDAIRHVPDHHPTLFVQGQLALARGNFADAISLFQQLVSANPSSTSARCFLHLAWTAAGQPGRTLPLLLAATGIDATMALPHTLLAKAYLQAGNVDAALASACHAIALKPHCAESLDLRSQIYTTQAQATNSALTIQLALDDSNRASLANPDNAQFLAQRASVLSHLNRFTDALADINRALALSPSSQHYEMLRVAVTAEIEARLGTAR